MVIVHIVYIHESNPYTPLVRIKSIQICYQLLQTRPTGEKRYLLLQPTHPATDAMRGSVRCTARDAMQCAARGLVAVAGAGDAMLLTMVLWVVITF